jgi:hypothetical protein
MRRVIPPLSHINGCNATPERPERGGPCCLLKLRQMGTYRVKMKGVIPWLVRWACRAGTRDFYPALAALVRPVQNIFFLTVHFSTICFDHIDQQPGQAVVPGRLSLILVSLAIPNIVSPLSMSFS